MKAPRWTQGEQYAGIGGYGSALLLSRDFGDRILATGEALRASLHGLVLGPVFDSDLAA